MKNIFFLLVLVVFAVACSNSTEPQIVEPASAENSGIQNSASTIPVSPDQQSQSMNSGTTNTLRAPNAAPTAPAQGNATASGPNPPHGQPGHRCDIAVGAPLNSPPNTPPAPAPTPIAPSSGMPSPSFAPSTPVTAPPLAPSAPVTSASGMNPPHGQPGHDCTIAVGAPLKKQTDSTGKK